MEVFKKIIGFLVLLCGLSLHGQDCPELITPRNGETNVPLDVTLEWELVEDVPGYRIELGREVGANDILITTVGSTTNTLDITNVILGLPEDTLIYMTITLIFPDDTDKPDIVCDSYSFQTVAVTSPPPCTEVTSPLEGAENVPVGTLIRWEYSLSAIRYRLSIGTSPDATDLLDEFDVGNTLSYALPGGLPELSTIYVRITPENDIGPASCPEIFSFTTGPFDTPPACTTMVYPMDGELNVPTLPTIEWNAVDGADGYFVFLDTSPFFDDDPILNGVRYTTTSFRISDIRPLDDNSVFFLLIIPFNEAGEAQGCEPPTTFTTLQGCGPFFNAEGEIIDLRPELSFPDTRGICADGRMVQAGVIADGYRWYRIPSIGREELLWEGPEFEILEAGEYRLEVYNYGPEEAFECRSEQIFTVSESEAAVIERTNVELRAGAIDIEVLASGIGDYEYALNSPEGPYQDSNRFTNLPIDNYRVFVRDKNGCGITEKPVELDLTLEGFPKFFTPNGDGVNDTWQYIPPPSGLNPIRELHIFDRYGKLLAQIDPRSQGWNGTFNGRPLPASDYWFRAVDDNNQVLQGHFSLKR